MNSAPISETTKNDNSKRTLSDETSTTSTSQGKSKQPRVDPVLPGGELHGANTSHDNQTARPSETVSEIVDVAEVLNLKPGSRIEVRWDLMTVDDNTEQNQQEGNDNTTPQSSSETRWWGGNLLPDDGRTYTINNGDDQVTVPIRSIDYDPYPPSFQDRSIEDVCFLSNHSLLNVSSESRTCWRVEGDSWEPSPNDDLDDEGCDVEDIDDEISVASVSQEDGLREVLDTILKSVVEKPGIMAKMQSLDRSKQSEMATKIAATKERLVKKLLEKLNDNDENDGVEKVITPDIVKTVMSELAKELIN